MATTLTAPTAPATQTKQPPAWLLWVMALPLGLVLNAMTLWSFNELSDLVFLMADETTHFERGLSGLLASTLIPSLPTFALLRFTRLAEWLAPKRLLLNLLLVFNMVFMAFWAYQLYLAGTGQWSYLRW